MTQFFEVFKGTPYDLRNRLIAMKTAGATGLTVVLTTAAAMYLISYSAPSAVTPAQPQA